MSRKLTKEETIVLRQKIKEAKKEERKQRKDARKLQKIQKKSTKKLRKIEKKFEKVQIKSDTKAKKYVPPMTDLPDKQRPRVGDPVLFSKQAEDQNAKRINEKELEKQRIRSERREQKLRAEKEKLERKRIASGDLTMYERFDRVRFEDLEERFMKATSRDERAFYRTLLNLKLQIEQEKVIGEVLL